MKSGVSFQEILEEKMQAKTTFVSRETPDNDPKNLAFLLGELPVFRFKPAVFPRKNVTPSRKTRPAGPPHSLSSPQQTARDWFLSRGEKLRADFSQAELKTAFRRLALQLHPDTLGGSVSDFLDLKKNRALLEEVFKKAEESASR